MRSEDLLFRPRLPDPLAEMVKAHAQQRGLTANEFIVGILHRAMARRKVSSGARPLSEEEEGRLTSFPLLRQTSAIKDSPRR